MKSLYLVGAGGLGLTAVEILRSGGLGGCTLAGWIDDGLDAGGQGPLGLPVVGGREVLDGLGTGDAVLVCVGADHVRRELNAHVAALGIERPVAVHPSAVLFQDVELGAGSLVNAGAIIARHTTLGAGAIVNLAATVGHDVRAGEAVQISPGVNVAGAVTLGDGVFVGPGAVIIQGRAIGEWARVGAGAVVIHDVEAHTTVFGNPARVVDRRTTSGKPT